MSFRIPDEKINEIKNAADIVDVVSEFVILKKAGKNFVGLCPFHSEKTASFTVSPDKQIFHCFGCQEGGNIFSFLMKKDNLSYYEAINVLAKKYGIDLPENSADQKQQSERERLLEVNKLAMEYYSNILQKSDKGKKALKYLENRGVAYEIIKRFKLGYAPAGWNNITEFLSKKKISPLMIEKSGLAIGKKNNNGFYDRFRDRIIFPIFDVNLQVIGFGGRVLDDSLPKYLNSPETIIYNKRRSLYGLETAKTTCRKNGFVYIVEGYFDCIILHQFGFENTVAVLGTSLTSEHIGMLKGYVVKIFLIFDSDEAGVKAITRSINLFTKENLDVRIIVLPSGYDPDLFLRSYGRDKLISASSKAISIIHFLIDSAVKKHGLTVEGKISIISDLSKQLSLIDDDVAMSLYVKELSERINVDEKPILLRIREAKSQKSLIEPHRQVIGGNLRGQSDLKESSLLEQINQGFRQESKIIEMMLQFPEVMPEIRMYNVLNYFGNDELKSIGEIILKFEGQKSDLVSEVLKGIEDEKKKPIISKLAIGEEIWDIKGCRKLINQYILFNKNRKLQKEKNTREIKDAEKEENHESILRLLAEKQKKALQDKKQRESL